MKENKADNLLTNSASRMISYKHKMGQLEKIETKKRKDGGSEQAKMG